MFNEINKSLAIMAVAALFASCGKSNEVSPQMQIYNSAESALMLGNAELCTQLLDSLDRWTPSSDKEQKDIEAMRLSMSLRPKAIAVIAERDIILADSTINANRENLDQLKPMMKYITLPNVEGYYVAKDAYKEHFLNSTGLSARVTDIGEFYIVSSLNPSSGLRHIAISVSVAGQTATTPNVAYDGALNYRISGSEMITFTPSQSDSIGALIASYPNEKVDVTFIGETGKTKRIKLSATDAKGIATAYNYARSINAMRDATIAKEKYEKILQLASLRSSMQESKSE